MNVFVAALVGALIGGGIMFSGVAALFWFEKKQATKKANEIINDLKTAYINKLNNLNDVSKVSNISNLKMN